MTECKKCSECEGGWHHLMEACKNASEMVVACKHCDLEIPMHDKTTFVETTKEYYGFYFVCEGCGEEGGLGLPRYASKRIACPGECGASYVLWDNPITKTPDLMCVVKPVFEQS